MKSNPDSVTYNRASELFLQAVELAPTERARFLDAACGGDAGLRARVDELLAHDTEESFVADEPAIVRGAGPAHQELSAGQTVGRYRILEKIGEGGMAVVYRAEDTTLDRLVALKFLSPFIAAHPDSLRRFVREAKAAAAIDHPNVCPVYEINTEWERPYIAMAYLEGQTLGDRLAAEPLDIDSTLEIAIQACRGLEAAHAKGVVHRDIKPANLMISETPSGCLVRILDFGVARLSEQSLVTKTGLTVGTVAYMAPEQIERSDVDGRADLWALGVVLYRMAAGKLPFARPTTREVLTAIANAEPEPVSAGQRGLPRGLDEIIRKTLQKRPEGRHQSATALLRDLEELQQSCQTGVRTARLELDRKRTGRRRSLVLTCGAAAIALAVTVVATRPTVDEPGTPLAPVPFTSFEGAEDQAAISPDGTRIAFVWDGGLKDGRADLYVQLIGSYTPLRLTNTSGVEYSPAWSPDGKSIAFLRQLDDRFRGPGRSTVLTIPALGGPETALAEVRTNDRRREMDWSPSGEYLAVSDDGHIIFLSPQTGARVAAPFSTLDGESHGPRFDSTGKRLAVLWTPREGRPQIHIVPAGSGKPQVFFATAGDFAWKHDGSSLLLSKRWYGQTEMLRLRDGSIETSALSDVLAPDVRGSLLAFTRRTLSDNIWALELGTGPAGDRREKAFRLISSSRTQDTPRFSPDGKSIVFSSNRSGSEEIWACDRDGGNPRKLTSFNGAHVGTPRWSPHGRTVAFDVGFENVAPDIYTVSAAGGDAFRVTRDTAVDFLPSWSRDGQWIYFSSNRGGKQDIWKIRPEGGEAVAVTHNARGWEAFESADGKYLFYSIGEYSELRDATTLFRMDLPDGATTAFPEVGDAGARRYWAVAANGIYFVDTHKEPGWIQFIGFGSRKISKVHPIGNLVFGPGALAVSPDGGTLLFVQRDVDEQDIMLVENFE